MTKTSRYSVLRNGYYSQVVFGSDHPVDVYLWLKENGGLDTPRYVVIDTIALTKWEEGTFVRECEEQIPKFIEDAKKREVLTEEWIRGIVREELAKAQEERLGDS